MKNNCVQPPEEKFGRTDLKKLLRHGSVSGDHGEPDFPGRNTSLRDCVAHSPEELDLPIVHAGKDLKK